MTEGWSVGQIADRGAMWTNDPFKDPVMQWAGLLDKNGNEWWEGDIIQIIDPEDTSKAVIVFEQGSFRKKYTSHHVNSN